VRPPGGAAPAGRDYLSLRAAAAGFMRSNPDDYAPFVVEGDAEGDEGEDGCARRLEHAGSMQQSSVHARHLCSDVGMCDARFMNQV
jgi:hypothetical protein